MLFDTAEWLSDLWNTDKPRFVELFHVTYVTYNGRAIRNKVFASLKTS